MRAAASVGRVGGLAVALGIGAAVTVGCAGTAWADSTDPAPASSTKSEATQHSSAGPRSRKPAAAVARTSSAPAAVRRQAPATASVAGAKAPVATTKARASATTSNSVGSSFFNATPTLSSTGNPVQGANGVVTGALNPFDADGDPLKYTVTAAPSHGTVTIDADGGGYTYTASESVAYDGTTDSFTVTASDAGAAPHLHGIGGLLNLLSFGFLGSSGHTTSLTVPVTVVAWRRSESDPTATVTVGSPNATTGVVLGRVVATDPNDEPLTYSTTAGPAKGTVAVAANGSFTYTPTASARHAAASDSAAEADLTDSFTITVSNTQGGTADVAVSVTIAPKNSAPVAGTPVVGTPNPSTGVVTGSVSATDADNDTLTYSTPVTTTKGSVSIDAGTGSFTYTPGSGAQGPTASTDSFTVTITDGHGGSTPVAVSVPIDAAEPSTARVTYSFNYTSGAEYWSDDAINALQYAADAIASYIVVTQPVTLTFNVSASNEPDSGTLASTGSDLTGFDSGYSYTVVQNKLLEGVDANGSQADGDIDVNFGTPWAYGDTVGRNQYDFISTMMHELMHAYGFLSYLDEAGYNRDTQWPVFDSFVTDQEGTLVINGSYRFRTIFNTNLTGGNGGMYFSGANAVAAYGGLVPLYTPDPWEAGSSLSHLDDYTFTGADAQLMNALADTGLGVRVLSAIEQGILQDLGYTLSAT